MPGTTHTLPAALARGARARDGTLAVGRSGHAWSSLLLTRAEAGPMARRARGAQSPAGDTQYQRSQALRTAGPSQPSPGGRDCPAAAYHPNTCLRAPMGTPADRRPPPYRFYPCVLNRLPTTHNAPGDALNPLQGRNTGCPRVRAGEPGEVALGCPRQKGPQRPWKGGPDRGRGKRLTRKDGSRQPQSILGAQAGAGAGGHGAGGGLGKKPGRTGQRGPGRHAQVSLPYPKGYDRARGLQHNPPRWGRPSVVPPTTRLSRAPAWQLVCWGRSCVQGSPSGGFAAGREGGPAGRLRPAA